MKGTRLTGAVFESKMEHRLLVEREMKRKEQSKSEGGCKRDSSLANRNTRQELEVGGERLG